MMTREQAMAILRKTHGEIKQIEPDLFGGRVDGKLTLFRLKSGQLQQRFDDNVHSCRWEVIE